MHKFGAVYYIHKINVENLLGEVSTIIYKEKDGMQSNEELEWTKWKFKSCFKIKIML